MSPRRTKRVYDRNSKILTIIFLTVILIGLVYLSAAKLSELGILFLPTIEPNTTVEDLYDFSLMMFTIGAIGLLSPLYFSRKSLDIRCEELGGWSKDDIALRMEENNDHDEHYILFETFNMNTRMWLLQIYLVISTIICWLSFYLVDFHIKEVLVPALYSKITVMLALAYIMTGAIKSLGLAPNSCRLWSGFDPIAWYKVVFNKYDTPLDTAVMSAIIGINLLAIGYAFLYNPIVSDPFFTTGSLFMSLFAIRGFMLIREWILIFWAILNVLCTLSGLVNCYITFCL